MLFFVCSPVVSVKVLCAFAAHRYDKHCGRLLHVLAAVVLLTAFVLCVEPNIFVTSHIRKRIPFALLVVCQHCCCRCCCCSFQCFRFTISPSQISSLACSANINMHISMDVCLCFCKHTHNLAVHIIILQFTERKGKRRIAKNLRVRQSSTVHWFFFFSNLNQF